VSTVAKMKAWLVQPVDRMVVQVPRALVASILSALLDCLYMVFLVEVCRWHPVPAAILSYLVGGLLQYVLCSVWVFPNAPGNKFTGFLTFTLLSLGGLVITWIVMAAGSALLLPYGLSKVLALGMAFVWNFASRKFLLFS
jgi:putative flippase GtrA